MGACRRLARLLSVPEPHALGVAMMLWQWALEIAPDGDFAGFVPETGNNAADTGILAAAVGWPVEDSARLVTELQRVGFLEVAPRLRVRGLDRYRRAWEKNNRKPNKWLNSGDVVPETGATRAGNSALSARQTQTQTQTQTENQTTILVEQAPLLPVEPPKAKPPKVRPMAIKTDDMSDDEWAVFDHWRVSTGKLNAMLDPKRLALIRRWLATPGVTVQRLQRAIDGCCKTPWNRGENPHRRRYLDLELILRDAAQFEKFEAAA